MTRGLSLGLLVVTFIGAPVLLLARASSAQDPPGQQPPTNVSPPTITGTATLGQTLSGNAGDWDGPGISFSYAWLRCDGVGGSCEPISGADGSHYSLVEADVGSTVRFLVTATNQNGSSAAFSDQTAAVEDPEPPDTAIESLTCTYHPQGGTRCRDIDGNGGETTNLSYSITHANRAEYLLHFDGYPDEWRPLAPSTDQVWFDSFPNCDPQTLQVRARRGDGAVDPTPATVQMVIEPFGGCPPVPPPPPPPPAPAPPPPPPPDAYAANSFEGNLLDDLTGWPFHVVPSFDPTLYLPVAGASGQGLGEVVTPVSPGPNDQSQSTATGVPASVAHASQGEETWYRVRIRFPAGAYHPAPQDWNWTFEWHNDPHTAAYGYKSPVLGVFTDSAGEHPRFHFRPWGGQGWAPTIEHWYTAPDSLQLDHWYDLVFHVVWDTQAAGQGGSGLIEFWLDGQPFDGHLGCSACPTVWSNPHPFPTLTANPDGTVSYQTNALYNYRQAVWPLGVTSSRIDYDEWRIGPSAASVGFTP